MYKCIERLRSYLYTKTVFKNREYPKVVSITWNDDLLMNIERVPKNYYGWSVINKEKDFILLLDFMGYFNYVSNNKYRKSVVIFYNEKDVKVINME